MAERSRHKENSERDFRLGALERELREQGFELVGGVDEAGRGPLAGPVCAAVVVFAPGSFVEGVNDSKQLSPAKREALEERIRRAALDWAVGWADPIEIDAMNILRATKLAVRRALATLRRPPHVLLLDALHLEDCELPQHSLVKGDARCHVIAAASILAKVARDRAMIRLEQEYPGYGFGRHKGYPTKKHYEAIERYGLTTAHRRSFVSEDLFRRAVRHSRTYCRLREKIAAKAASPAELRSELQSAAELLPLVEIQKLEKLLEDFESSWGS